MTTDWAGDVGAMANAGVSVRPDQFTGAYIALLDVAAVDVGVQLLTTAAGMAPAQHISGSLGDEGVSEALAHDGPVVLDEIGVAVLHPAPNQQMALIQAAAEAPQVIALEAEKLNWIFYEGASDDYLRGFRDGVDAAVDRAIGAISADAAGARAQVWDETLATWGLQATRVAQSCYSGSGVGVAILDTGVDLTHRDLIGRVIKAASFIAGESVEDGHGHGTHCIGTACGTKDPRTLPRYGIAGGATIHAGKVLSNGGSGADRGILAGINWAVAERCRVISMSLGAPTNVGDTYSRVYEGVAQRAMAKGTLIVAAAGNESSRPGSIMPVGHPANCPSILAVAALTRDLAIAPFSCAGLNPDGGQVDIAGPGVDVLSSFPEPAGYRRWAGTSMATPHVAGVLALLAEANAAASPAELKVSLLTKARRLTLPASDVGAGLVQAP